MKRYIFVNVLFALLLCVSFVANVQAQVYSWGFNYWGQLGIGNYDNMLEFSPQLVASVPGTTAISSRGNRTFFIMPDGTVFAVGNNYQRALGTQSTAAYETSPMLVLGLGDVLQVRPTDNGITRALRSDGTVRRWGFYDGGGTISGFQLESVTDVVQIANGQQHFLSLKADGTVWGTGRNYEGQLGDGTQTQPFLPVRAGQNVPGFTDIIAIDAEGDRSVALKGDGTVWGWGKNYGGLTGDGIPTSIQLNPVKYELLTNVVQVSAGHEFNVALKRDGTVWAWGSNYWGTFGNGETHTRYKEPQQVNISDVIEIEAEGRHVVVRKRDGSVWGWGYNQSGAVGNCPHIECEFLPSPVQNLYTAGNVIIAAGSDNTFIGKPVIKTWPGAFVRHYGENVSMTFSRVRRTGNTIYTAIDPATVILNVPAGYIIQANQPAYNINTTAAAQGEIEVCLKAPNEFDRTEFSFLKILHAEGANWVDRTISSDFMRRQLCARVDSLGSFVVAKTGSGFGK